MSVRKEFAYELIEAIGVIIEDIEIEYGENEPIFSINARASILNQVIRMEKLERWDDLEHYLREEERCLRSKLNRMRNKRLDLEKNLREKADKEKKAKIIKFVAGGLAFSITSALPLAISAIVNWHNIVSKWPW